MSRIDPLPLMSRHVRLWMAVYFAFVVTVASATAEPNEQTATAPSNWRAPTALWITPDGSTLYAAGSKSGTVSAIDLETQNVVSETQFGRSLAGLAGTPDGQTLVSCDSAANELVIAKRRGTEFQVQSRVPVPATPTSVCLDPNGITCFVSSRWSRTITRVDLQSGAILATIPLDFSPHLSMSLPNQPTLLVADAFGGHLALIDTDTAHIIRGVEIPGHNIRGIALSPDRKQLLITHSILTESAATTRDNVFWGILMTANMRVIPIAALLDSTKNPVREAHTHFFGDPGNAAGDPESLAILPDSTTIVCLAGVGDVAIGRTTPYGFRRIGVGDRPAAVAVSPDHKWAYIANAHSDNVSVIDVAERAVVNTIPLGAEPKFTLEQEGERLFYNARLSLDGWFSCHTCHTDGHTNGRRADTFSDGSYGAAKSVLSLLGTGATEPWAWNGSKRTLEEQIRDSMRTSMQPKSTPSERDVAALTAYLRTLKPPPGADSRRLDPHAIARGKNLFNVRGCTTCHAPPLYSNSHVYDVGLNDGEGGNRQFNPPSLRGIVHKGPYFHDGRAKTLQEVVGKYQHRLRTALSQDEQHDLVEFLQSL